MPDGMLAEHGSTQLLQDVDGMMQLPGTPTKNTAAESLRTPCKVCKPLSVSRMADLESQSPWIPSGMEQWAPWKACDNFNFISYAPMPNLGVCANTGSMLESQGMLRRVSKRPTVNTQLMSSPTAGLDPAVDSPITPRRLSPPRYCTPPSKRRSCTPPPHVKSCSIPKPKLLKALESGCLRQTRCILEDNPDIVNEPFWDHLGELPFCCALRLNCPDSILQLLLEHGAGTGASAVSGFEMS